MLRSKRAKRVRAASACSRNRSRAHPLRGCDSLNFGREALGFGVLVIA